MKALKKVVYIISIEKIMEISGGFHSLSLCPLAFSYFTV